MDNIDTTKIRARGPWVLVKPEEVKHITKGGLYVPEGNLLERLGHIVGEVVSVGEGYWEKIEGKTKKVFVRPEIKPGDRVVFRGHLQDANRVDRNHCFMHIRDLIGTLEDGAELDLSLPHND